MMPSIENSISTSPSSTPVRGAVEALRRLVQRIRTDRDATRSYFDAAGAKSYVFLFGADRMTFLTYGYLRGRAYRTLEPTARPFEVTYGYAGKDFANALAEAIRSVLVTEEPNVEAPTEAEIKAWLAIPETAERTAARAAALRAAAEKRAKTAAQYRAARRCSGEGA